VTVRDRRCGFCGKRRRHVRGMATAGAVTICADCLVLCDEILTEAGVR
jgi:ATP-dependent protease Clp ATPase subunit